MAWLGDLESHLISVHWREQMRAVVQRYPEFECIQSGVYAVA